MSDFKNGGVPSPDYDKDDVTIFNDTTEFTNDVFVYGKLYADLGGDLHTFTGNVDIDGSLDANNGLNVTGNINADGQIILTSNGISGGGIYHHKRTISTSGSQFFKLENQHGATAATIYLTSSVSDFSVSKVYQFAGQHNGGSGGLNLVADSGAYSGKNINLTVNSTQDVHQFTCTATGSNVEVFVTIVVGCAATNMVFTKQ